MSFSTEKVLHTSLVHGDVPEDAVPRLNRRAVEVLRAEEGAHLSVKAVEAAEKVYGRYSKWFLFIGISLA